MLHHLGIPRARNAGGASPLPKGYAPVIVISLMLILGSLALLTLCVGIFYASYQATPMPVWLVLLGVAAILGTLLGFGGLLSLMAWAGYRGWRELRRQALAPVPDSPHP